MVARDEFGEDKGFLTRDSKGLQLLPAAVRSRFGTCIDEQLGRGTWTDDGADIAPIDHRPSALAHRPRREIALELKQRGAHRRMGRYLRRRLAYGIGADRRL